MGALEGRIKRREKKESTFKLEGGGASREFQFLRNKSES